MRDLGDWVVETRVKTSQLLYHLLLHAEVYTTQHMQPLTQALLKASVDEDPRVVKGVSWFYTAFKVLDTSRCVLQLQVRLIRIYFRNKACLITSIII